MNFKDIDPSIAYPLPDIHEYIIERDNGLCQICGTVGTEKHHIKFRSNRGLDHANNLILLCIKCHKMIHIEVAKEYEGALKRRVIKNEKQLRKRLI